MENLTLRNLAVTPIAAAVIIPFIGYLVRGSMPFVPDPRGIAGSLCLWPAMPGTCRPGAWSGRGNDHYPGDPAVSLRASADDRAGDRAVWEVAHA
jgi:hypothetical protein